MVDELVGEVGRSDLPRPSELMAAEAGGDLPHAVAKEAGRVELAEAGVDQRMPEPGAGEHEPARIGRVDRPRVAVAMVAAPREKIPPEKFKPQPVGPLVGPVLRLVAGEIVGEAARREAAPGKPGRELAGEIPTEELVPRPLVAVGQPPIAVALPVLPSGRLPPGCDQWESGDDDRRADDTVGERRESLRRCDRRAEADTSSLDLLAEGSVGARHRRRVEGQIGLVNHPPRGVVHLADGGRGGLGQEEEIGAALAERRLKVGERRDEEGLLVGAPPDRRIEREDRQEPRTAGGRRGEERIVVEP